MKINEITNAEDMLALQKLISDNTCSAIQQQTMKKCVEAGELDVQIDAGNVAVRARFKH